MTLAQPELLDALLTHALPQLEQRVFITGGQQFPHPAPPFLSCLWRKAVPPSPEGWHVGVGGGEPREVYSEVGAFIYIVFRCPLRAKCLTIHNCLRKRGYGRYFFFLIELSWILDSM